jgi:hypothetical protein
MGRLVIGLAIVIGLLWAFVSFRSFRKVVGIIALIGVGLIVANNIEAEKNRQQELAEQSQSGARKQRAEEYQRVLWSKISPSEVELRDPTLHPSTYGDEFDLQVSAKNLSDQPLGAVEIEVIASDCSPHKVCEVIGHSTIEVWTDIPAQQVRGLSGKITLRNMPKLRGTFSPAFRVTRVYAGDFFDKYKRF